VNPKAGFANGKESLPPELISPESIWSETEKIASSRTFRSAVGQRHFLRFAVTEALQGRGHLLKEYSIGIAVFRKKESFDPRLDSIVRTEARKLRARLAKYFESEGKDDTLRIHFPLGKYTPTFQQISRNSKAGDEESRVLARRNEPSDCDCQTSTPGALGLSPPSRKSSPLLAPHMNSRHRQALRIAVLPFGNRSAEKRDEFFSDGLTDELSHAFANIKGLEIVARTSAFQFKGQPMDVREIGRKLNVDAVIEGSVRRAGNRLRILAQLDDASSGNTVWSASYDRKLSQLFAVQREISTTITRELGIHFDDRQPLIGVNGSSYDFAASSPVLYEEYLQGQYFWNRHTVEDFEAAIGCFQRVIAKEAKFARAYTSLAYCYVMLPMMKAILPSEFIPKIRLAASTALEIDSSAGGAYFALALPLIHDFDWSAAGDAFRRGLELCPSDVIGHAWHGTYLMSVGRSEEALSEQEKVLELDPASVPALFSYAQTLYYLRRYDEAIEQFRKALALNPSFPREHAGLGLSCVHKGSYMRGIAELESAQELTPGLGRVRSNLGYAYAVSGNRAKALEILNELLRLFSPNSFPAAMIAEVYIGLADKDRAFEWLHKAVDQKDLAVFLKTDPLYDPLRPDPRFATLLRRMNLA